MTPWMSQAVNYMHQNTLYPTLSLLRMCILKISYLASTTHRSLMYGYIVMLQLLILPCPVQHLPTNEEPATCSGFDRWHMLHASDCHTTSSSWLNRCSPSSATERPAMHDCWQLGGHSVVSEIDRVSAIRGLPRPLICLYPRQRALPPTRIEVRALHWGLPWYRIGGDSPRWWR